MPRLAGDWHAANAPLALWRSRSLVTQFMLISSLTVVLSMFVVGRWVTSEIQKGVINGAAAATALFSDSLIEPHVQELKLGTSLSPESRRQLDKLLLPHTAGKAILAFKVWQGDTIVYSSRPELIGRSFPPTETRLRAWSGQVVPAFGRLVGSDDIGEQIPNVPILEVFAPVRETGTNRIIALAETYEAAVTLRDNLSDARIGSWLVVASVTLSLIGFQFGVVAEGSKTIDEQRQLLNDRIAALTELLAENERLRDRSNNANRRVTEINERLLRRIGADLHDGPVQLLGLIQLRLGCLREILRRVTPSEDNEMTRDAEEDFRVIEESVTDSLFEIRNVAVGLVPPEIEKLDLDEALTMVARRHQRRTGRDVTCNIGKLPNIPIALKACLYRFAQEGLNNAFRHADGRGQILEAGIVGERIEVKVLDGGPGIAPAKIYDGIGGQGLILLRDRVECLGGTFVIGNRTGTRGACLEASFDLRSEHTPEGDPHV